VMSEPLPPRCPKLDKPHAQSDEQQEGVTR